MRLLSEVGAGVAAVLAEPVCKRVFTNCTFGGCQDCLHNVGLFRGADDPVQFQKYDGRDVSCSFIAIVEGMSPDQPVTICRRKGVKVRRWIVIMPFVQGASESGFQDVVVSDARRIPAK